MRLRRRTWSTVPSAVFPCLPRRRGGVTAGSRTGGWRLGGLLRHKRGQVHIPQTWCLSTHVPSGPTGRPFDEPCGRRRRIVGPLGRRTTWSRGPFPARWAGLGERLARWAGSWIAVRGPTVRTKRRWRPIQPARRERGPLCPLRWAFFRRRPCRWAENNLGSAQPFVISMPGHVSWFVGLRHRTSTQAVS
jgi:hypothetical protein